MHWIDAVFLFFLFGVMPIYGAVSYKRYLQRIAAGDLADRVSLYLGSMLLQSAALLVLLVTWAILDRPRQDLGILLPERQGLLIGAVIIVLSTGLLVYALIIARRLNANSRQAQIGSLGDLVHFLPQTDKELRAAYLLSVTAGVVEEIVYRGFVLWCLFLYFPDWLALVISSVAFGLAHSYQGVAGVFKTGGLGLVLAMIYVGTGTIWIPVIIHALIDILQMATARELFRPVSEPEAIQQ